MQQYNQTQKKIIVNKYLKTYTNAFLHSSTMCKITVKSAFFIGLLTQYHFQK